MGDQWRHCALCYVLLLLLLCSCCVYSSVVRHLAPLLLPALPLVLWSCPLQHCVMYTHSSVDHLINPLVSKVTIVYGWVIPLARAPGRHRPGAMVTYIWPWPPPPPLGPPTAIAATLSCIMPTTHSLCSPLPLPALPACHHTTRLHPLVPHLYLLARVCLPASSIERDGAPLRRRRQERATRTGASPSTPRPAGAGLNASANGRTTGFLISSWTPPHNSPSPLPQPCPPPSTPPSPPPQLPSCASHLQRQRRPS